MLKLKSLLFFLGCVLCCFSLNTFADTNSTETTGQYVEGTAITTSVKAKLLADSDISSFDISVDTTGGVVTLTGTVDTQDQKNKAESIAKTVDGVTSVKNQLKIKAE